MSPSSRPPDTWDSFFKELDEAVDTTVRVDCIGGFVVTLLYGLERPTADIDVIELAPRAAAETMMELGIRGGPLHQKYRIYLDRVAVAAIPESYEDRLVEMFPGAYRHLHLMALDPYRPGPVQTRKKQPEGWRRRTLLARTVPFDLDILEEHYARNYDGNSVCPKRRSDPATVAGCDPRGPRNRPDIRRTERFLSTPPSDVLSSWNAYTD